jgi:N-acetylglucosaminyldiphosphoundecaprenol N-acetyl-beta-D-mannosaminyltransferase
MNVFIKDSSLPPKFDILGVKISVINMCQALETINQWIVKNESNYVCVTPAHGVMECQRNPNLLDIFNSSGLTTPDGMAIVWLLKLNGFRNVSRVYGPDLMRAVCKHSSEKANYRHFLYGGAPGVVQQLSEKLSEQYPNLNIVGTYTPPFRELTKTEDTEIINKINLSDADIVWVGISTPKQEMWMASHLESLNSPVLIGVGAAFDFIAGTKREAPKWIQRFGMQWLFRLIMEPNRLWRRYAEYPYFVWLVVRESLIKFWNNIAISS